MSLNSSSLLAMIRFLESVEGFQRTTLALEPEECSVIVAAIEARIALLFTIACTCHGKPEKLVSCQPICAKQQVFAAVLFPLQVVVVSEVKLVQCLLKTPGVDMKNLEKGVYWFY